MKIEILRGDITELDVEAIVNPANSYLEMGGGLAGILRRKAGREVQEEALRKAPCPVGKAVATSAGNLKARYIIHAPTMKNPAEKISVENVKLAMKGILECAEQNNIKVVAIPGLGTGVGGVDEKEAAKAMVEAARNFDSDAIEKIIFVGYSDGLYRGFKDAIQDGVSS